FLSTSLDKDISLEFARHAIDKLGLRGVIFRMKIDPKKDNLSNPCASLIYLKLTTNQDDIQLEQLTKYLREDLQCSLNPWESLAKLMLNIEQIDEYILEKTSLNDHQLCCVHNGKKS
ncbi:unnamed protein product, partial [Rotaria sp. Silwood2]